MERFQRAQSSRGAGLRKIDIQKRMCQSATQADDLPRQSRCQYQKYQIDINDLPQYKRIVTMMDVLRKNLTEIVDTLKCSNHNAPLEYYDHKHEWRNIYVILEEPTVLKKFTKSFSSRKPLQDGDVNEYITILQIGDGSDSTGSIEKELKKRKLSADNVVFFIDENPGVSQHTSAEFAIVTNGKGIRKAVTEYYEKKMYMELEEIEHWIQSIEEGLTTSLIPGSIMEDAMNRTNIALSKCETIRKTMMPIIGRTMNKNTTQYPENLYMQLDKLDKEGLIGYGHFLGKLRIDVDEKKLSSKSNFEAKIKEIFSDYREKPEINYKAKRITTYVNPGDKLFIRHEPTESYGTIGAFAKDKLSITGFTCWHVIKDNETPSVCVNSDPKIFGNVVFKSDTYDFAALDITDDFVKSNPINTEIQHSNGKTLKPTLFDDRSVDLTSSEVYKIGASTNHTTGVVVSSNYKCLDPLAIADNILVQGYEEMQPFAKKGDSGSIIYRLDPEDVDDETAQLISMFQGEMLSREEKHEPLSFSFRIDKPIEETNNKLKRKLQFN